MIAPAGGAWGGVDTLEKRTKEPGKCTDECMRLFGNCLITT